MEKQILFRDYQEQMAQDHKDLQDFARASLDHVVYDAVTKRRAFSGFATIKSAQTELQIQPGRFYSNDGAVYPRATTLVQSVLSYLPAAARRVISITAYGVENETDVEERDFLVDVATGRTEPDAVATTKSRDAVIAIVAGAESADPQPPAIPVTSVEIARILLDPTQVVSVGMMPENTIASTEDLDIRTDGLEGFRKQIEPRVASLASDLAALANRLKGAGQAFDIRKIYEDLARVKVRVQLPEAYSDYGADNYLLPTQSDTDNSQNLGYDALLEEGIRFADANADEFEISLFSQNDPNATVSNGLVLPKYTSVLKLTTGDYHSDLGIAQYGFQTYALKQGAIAKERLRFGGRYMQCTNGAGWWEAGGDPALYWLTDFTTWQEARQTYNDGHWIRTEYWWHDSWKEPYWYLETIEHTITGAQIAQSFLVSNDMWATRVGFYITQKAANEAIHISLCEIVNGVPDLQKVIAHQTYNHNDILAGWNRVEIAPTFLSSGKRYALVLTSAANHRVGMTYGSNYADGTFFYSTDGVYYLGDLTKDLMVEVWGARFHSPQVTIEFAPINLDGGIRSIDLLARTIVPASTQLIYEIRPNGTGEWYPLTPENIAVLSTAPPLFQFRGRFVGTRDVAPGLMLTGSRVHVGRPKTTFRHVSEPATLATPSDKITVKLLLEGFDDIPHDCVCRLQIGATVEAADATVTELTNADLRQYTRSFTFQLPAPVTTFTILIEGATNAPTTTFHVAERIFWALP